MRNRKRAKNDRRLGTFKLDRLASDKRNIHLITVIPYEIINQTDGYPRFVQIEGIIRRFKEHKEGTLLDDNVDVLLHTIVRISLVVRSC